MRRSSLLIGLALVVLVVGGVFLFLWERRQAPPATREGEERLLIGFEPARVSRLRVRVGARQLDLTRTPEGWEPTGGGSAADAALRPEVVLSRLARLGVRPAPPARGRRPASAGAPDAEITVWRGAVSRPVTLGLRRQGGRLLVTTSDRPGEYAADAALLTFLESEVKPGGTATRQRFAPDGISALTLDRGAGPVRLAHSGGRWSVVLGSGTTPANAESVARLIRTVAGMVVTARLGKGEAEIARHGLATPKVTIEITAGATLRFRLGGECPRGEGGYVALLPEAPDEVVCVSVPEGPAWEAPLAVRRLFSLAPDEVRLLRVERRGRTLGLSLQVGEAGWTAEPRMARPIDQEATSAFVADVARLEFLATPAPGPEAPAGATRVGEVVLGARPGEEEKVELHLAREGGLWARRGGTGPYLALPPSAGALLAADPILLRGRTICSLDPALVDSVVKVGPDGHTEVLHRDGGTWQLLVLERPQADDVALRILRELHTYQPPSRPGDTAPQPYRRPVLLAGPPDAESITRLLRPLAPLAARRWIASSAERDHGIGQGGRLTAVFRTQCQAEHGEAPRCVEARCAVVLGVPTAEGRCTAQATGDRAVLEAERDLCEVVRAPLSSRLVVESGLEQLATITLRAGGRTLSLRRSAEGAWQGPADRADLTADTLAEGLVGLAPLTAMGVEAYGALPAPALTVELRPAPRSSHTPPPMTLLLAAGGEGEAAGLTRLARADRPVIHRVPASLAAGLLRLLRGK